MVDKVNVSPKQRIALSFSQVNSDWRQGIHISTAGTFEVDGQGIKNALVLWEDTAPSEVEFIVRSKSGYALVKNVWDVGDGVIHSWHGGGAMLVSDGPDGRLYECNDGRADEDFNDLIFRLVLRD
jgi:hypothetical protein